MCVFVLFFLMQLVYGFKQILLWLMLCLFLVVG
jgi:hypothetical protein